MARAIDLTKHKIKHLPTTLEIQTTPNISQLKPAALAVALGVTVESVLLCCRHDGLEVVCDQTPDNTRFRGFTVQEMIDICLSQGLDVEEIDLDLGDNPPREYHRQVSTQRNRQVVDWDRFEVKMLSSHGLVVYDNLESLATNEQVLAFRGDGENVIFVDPILGIEFLYTGYEDLLAQKCQFITLICIASP